MNVGIIGIGKLGSVLGRRAVTAGHRVVLAGRPGAEMTDLVAAVMVPGAEVAPVSEWPGVDVAVLAVPLSVALRMDLPLPDGTVVIDATNHWTPVDGEPVVDGTPSTVRVAGAHPRLRWVKALNHLGYHDLEDLPRQAEPAIAVGIAADDANAAAAAAAFVASLGLDPVPAGTLADSRILEEGGPVFGAPLTRAQWQRAVPRSVPELQQQPAPSAHENHDPRGEPPGLQEHQAHRRQRQG